MRGALLLVVGALLLAGCTSVGVELSPARVPDRLLEGAGGNGWEKNLSQSDATPTSAQGGFSKSQTLVYEDRRSEEGHPGTLTVTTLRTILRPSEEKVREVVRDKIREEAEAKGVRIDGEAKTGTRRVVASGESFWFLYEGSVQSSTFFQARNARVKIYGEVFQCDKNVVVVVGLAQVSDVRTVGGVQLPSEEDPTTWNEIASDPRGSIEGIRGSDGLSYNVAC